LDTNELKKYFFAFFYNLIDFYTGEFLNQLTPFSKSSKFGPYFAFLPGDKNKTICLVINSQNKKCGKIVPSLKGNTVGLLKHLKDHGIDPDSSVDKSVKIDQFVKPFLQTNNIEIIVAKLVCHDFIPPNRIACSNSIQHLISKSFNQSLSRHSIWQMIYKVYEELKKEIIKKLSESTLVSVTTDDWTSKANNGFCNINLYTTQNDQIHRISLGVVKTSGTTGENLLKLIQEKLSEFKVKAYFITTDGAANMEKMTSLGAFYQQKCFLHGIHLFVCDFIFSKKYYPISEQSQTNDLEDASDEDSFSQQSEEENEEEKEDSDVDQDSEESFSGSNIFDESSGETIEKVRKIMRFLKRSVKARDHLKFHTDLAPKLDCITRWSSTYLMLTRFIKIYRPLCLSAVDSDAIKEKLNFSNQEISCLKAIIKILEPVANLTTLLSASDLNLITCDLLVEKCSQQLPEFMKNEFLDRVLSRRKIWSDILLYLTNQGHLVKFYKQPSDFEIKKIFEKVIKIHFYK